jgi:hypothetical protein
VVTANRHSHLFAVNGLLLLKRSLEGIGGTLAMVEALGEPFGFLAVGVAQRVASTVVIH